MSLAQRRLLFYFFIFLFALAVPFVLLYATGNAINWQRLELEKTSGIIVDSDPTGATLSLNGKTPGTFTLRFFGQTTDPHTRAKITGLLPGDYTLRLELAGYAPWEEKINLQSGQVHNTGIVRLFRLDSSELLAETGSLPQAHALSPETATLAVLNGQKLTFINLTSRESNQLDLPEAPREKKLTWSPDGQHLLIGSEYLFDTSKGSLSPLKIFLNDTPVLARWSANNDLYALVDSDIWRLKPGSVHGEKLLNLKTLIPDPEIQDLTIEKDRAFILSAHASQSQFLAFDIGSIQRQTRATLTGGSYSFSADGRGELVISEKNGTLYQVEHVLPLLNSYRLIPLTDQYSSGQWNGSELLYATPFEVRRLNINAPDELITRWGEAIRDVARVPQSDYLVFGTGHSIIAFNTKKQAFSPSLPLVQLDDFSSFIRVEEHVILFLGSINGKTGLYRLGF